MWSRDNRPWAGWLGAILLAAALGRLAAAVLLVPAWEARAGRGHFPDRYPTLAASLVDRGTLGYAPDGAAITTGRGPGFPGWLALPMLTGLRGDRLLAWWATVPGLAGAALAAWATRRLGGRGLAPAVAAAVAGLHPLPVLDAARAMSDEFCGVLGLAGLVLWNASARAPRRAWWIAAAGLSLGLATLVRSTGVLFLVALLLAALWTRAPVGRTLALVALALAPPLAWSFRSSALEGRPVFVHSLGAYNFWMGEASARYGFAPDGRARARSLMAAEAGLPPETAGHLWHAALDPREMARLETALTHAAVREVRRAPLHYARRVVAGLGWFWIRGEAWTTTLAYAMLVLPVLLLALLGAGGMRAPDPLLLALLLAVALHTACYAAVYPMARYSVAVYPCLAPLAALGLARLYDGPEGPARSADAP